MVRYMNMTGTQEETLAGRIRQTRKDLAMNKTEFAELLDVTPRTVWNYENGHRTPPGFMLRKLARRAKKPLEFFTEVAA